LFKLFQGAGLALLLLLGQAHGQSLYQVSIALPEQAQGSDPAIQTRALTTVIERLIGQPILSPGPYAMLLEQPQPWILSWGFQSDLDEISRVATLTVDPELRRQVQALGAPVWTQPRPAQWLWLLVDQGQGRQPLTADPSSVIWRALQDQAERWQLPVAVPDWDQADRGLVNFSELWGLFMDGVEQAAPRYSETFNAGRVVQTGQGWQVSIKTQDGRRLDRSFASPEALAEGLFQWWLPELVSQYAISGIGQQDLAVYGLTPRGYQVLIEYLRAQDAIDRAHAVYSDPEVTVFRLQTGARVEQLESLLAGLDNLVAADPVETPIAVQTAVRWVP